MLLSASRCAKHRAAAPQSPWARSASPSGERASLRASAGPVQQCCRRMTQIELLQRSGYRRVGSLKSGFRYAGAPKRELPRLRALRLPPAWTGGAINPHPRAQLQAIGKDKKGRWQYRYSEGAVRVREQKKVGRLVAL